MLLILPLFFALGVGLHAVFAWFRVREFTSLLVTFGVTVIIESLIQWYWTADFRRYETPYARPRSGWGRSTCPRSSSWRA